MDDIAVTLRVKARRSVRGGAPRIYARWRREDGSSAEAPVGPGWLVPKGHADAKPRGKELGDWVDRRGRAPEGMFTADAALRAVPEILKADEARVAKQRAEEKRAGAGDVLLGDGIELWLVARKLDDPDERWEAWKHSHAENMTSYARRVARELGRDRLVRSFDTVELRDWLVNRLKPMRNGKVLEQPTSRKMRATYSQLLSGFFSYALIVGWIDEDPTAGLPAYRVPKKRAGDVLRREEYLTRRELDAALAELRRGDPTPASGRPRSWLEREQDAVMITTMAMVGLRPGEALALTWEYIDFVAKVIRIVDSRTMGQTGTPKSGSGRFIPLASSVADQLRGLLVRGVMTGPKDRVFIGRDGAHVDLADLGGRFDRAQTRAGISPCRDLRQMKNTFGTICAAEGIPLRTIQEYMGHASIETTEIYASFMPRDEDAARIEAAFG